MNYLQRIRMSKVLGGHTLKLEKPGCIMDSRKFFFSHRVVGHWNSLDQEMVDAPSLNAFNGRLDKLRQTSLGFSWTNPLALGPTG